MFNEIDNKGRLLVRAMDNPSLIRKDGKIVYDFSVWANEYELASNQGLYSLSTTLLVPHESIPTYKAIGFIIDENKSEIKHIAEQDSGSSGNELNGDFHANETGINTLSELENIIKHKHQNIMNEVNINIHNDAIIGLFANISGTNRTMANIIMAQKYFKMQTGKEIPIYMYDKKIGELLKLNMSGEEKEQFIRTCLEENILKTGDIYYETEKGELKEENFFFQDNEIGEDNMDVERLKNEIQTCSSNPSLNNEEKSTRLKLLQTMIQKIIQDNELNQEMTQYLQSGSELVDLTNGSYQLQESIDWNKIALKGLILEDDLCKQLEQQDINFSLSDLKSYSAEYSLNSGVDMTIFDKAISLYELSDQIEKRESNEIDMISNGLGSIIGKDIMSRNNEKGIIQADVKAVIQLTKKTFDEYSMCQKKALQKAEELYVNLGTLDRETYQHTVTMINQVFENYKNGNKKIPIKSLEQLNNINEINNIQRHIL